MKKQDDIYILEMSDRVARIARHLRGLSEAKFLKSELHRSAVVRELEVIGEAARMISDSTRIAYPEVPRKQMAGMRNRLIHEYFDVDYKIVWDVAKNDIPEIKDGLQKVFLAIAPPSHPWRPCPAGYYLVGPYRRHLKDSAATVGVREHCRRNPSGRDQLYPHEIKLISDSGSGQPSPYSLKSLSKFKNGDAFDKNISVWVEYWNGVFGPAHPLDPKIIKDLMASESSFDSKVKDQKVGPRDMARGLMQITDQTRKILGDEKGELKNFYLTVSKSDVKDPDIACASAVRWLFQKQKLASAFLKREASWEEAVAEYKSYLRRGNYRTAKGMKNFFDILNLLGGTGDQ